MKLQQDITQRAFDGAWEVWQKMHTAKPLAEIEAECLKQPDPQAYYEAAWKAQERWVLVAVLDTKEAAVRFCNACFACKSASAPDWAGDGSGASLSEPWISALRDRSAFNMVTA